MSHNRINRRLPRMRLLGAAAVMAGFALLSGCVAFPAHDGYGYAGGYDSQVTYVYTQYGNPPPLRREIRPRSPGYGYTWMAGEWGWGGSRYDWRPGRWVPHGQYVRPGVSRPPQRPPQVQQRPPQRPPQVQQRPHQRPPQVQERPPQRPPQAQQRPPQRPPQAQERPPQRPTPGQIWPGNRTLSHDPDGGA